jgi:hypothetical protein
MELGPRMSVEEAERKRPAEVMETARPRSRDDQSKSRMRQSPEPTMRRPFLEQTLRAGACLAFARKLWWAGATLTFAAEPVTHAGSIGLEVSAQEIQLKSGAQTWRFTRGDAGWAWAAVDVGGAAVVQSESRRDAYWLGAGEASGYEVVSDGPSEKAVRFLLTSGSILYRATAADPLPAVHVEIDRTNETICPFLSAASSRQEHGAWLTRGWVSTDADGSEAFIDASNPLVFGHSTDGTLDTGYLFIPTVHAHVQNNSRTEQRSGTFFKAERQLDGADQWRARWQLRLGEKEPKHFAVFFDRGIGRISDMCEKYFAPAVDSILDLSKVPKSQFSPETCLQVMPVRLAAPDAFIPGWGVMMDEFPQASYPYARDSVWQVPALLAFEGLATGRAWEHNFAKYFLDKTPLDGVDGKSYFVRRPGGLTRWGYFGTYRDGFIQLDGGTWWQADILYRTALALNDAQLRQAALDMVRHDLEVKLDLGKMSYPPCWNPVLNRVSDDHRDDWFKTPGLAYCAYIAARIAYPETHDPKYLAMADQIDEWFATYLVPEHKLNYLQESNMHAVFSHYLTLAFLEKYERSQERRFLDMARDMAWVHIMTTCTTLAQDGHGHSLTGTTCVGVRGCVDYDCAPNLCHEKDLTFVHIIGPLLDHVSGAAYAKYLALCRLVLDKDSWKSAWAMELRGTNLRTMYDTYARGMANLIFALEPVRNDKVGTVEKLVSKSDVHIDRQRDVIVFNGTPQPQDARVQIRYLRQGEYAVKVDGAEVRPESEHELAEGITVTMPPNSTKRIQVQAIRLTSAAAAPSAHYDHSVTWLSELTPLAAQRGTGFPEPTYGRDMSLRGTPIALANQRFEKGLGCAANTVLIYDLKGEFEEFQATVGVDASVAEKTDPPPSVFFTAFVDGQLRYESGPMRAQAPSQPVKITVGQAQTLMLRVSCNWDNNGRSKNDYGDWAQARLVGKRTQVAVFDMPTAPATPTADGIFNIVDFGAKADGSEDASPAVQRAIDVAAVQGGVVQVPVGRFLLNGPLVLKKGVHLSGINQAPQSWEPATGSILLATAGRDHEESPALIEMRSSTSIKGLTVYYPEQKVDDIRAYPWTIQIRADPAQPKEVSFDSTVENVTLINSYNGIRAGPTENGRHRLLQINGCVLRRGILIEGTGDIGRIENVHFHSHFWAHPAFGGDWKKVYAFMQQHLEAFVFGRTDWEYVQNTFVFPARVGYRFIESQDSEWGGTCNGQFSGIGADACDTCVLVEAIQPQGLLITNGEFNAHRVGRSTQVVVEPNCSGSIRFVNCGFWGPVLHNALLRGPSYVSFTDCYFSNDNHDDPGFAIVAEAGKLQVHQSTFDARSNQRKPGNAWTGQDVRQQPGSIELKRGVQSANISGNNGYYGVKIRNEIGQRALLSDNEPWHAPDSAQP